MRIAVLVKHVPDTWADRQINLETGMLDRDASDNLPDEINERTLETALQLRDSGRDCEIQLICMGPAEAEKSLRKLLSMGADSAMLISDESLQGSDMVQTAHVLFAAIQRSNPQLVLAGNRSTDGQGGVVPAMVSELLQWNLLPSLDEITIGESTVEGRLQTDGGVLGLSGALPAMVSLTEKVAEPRLSNFKGIMAAKKKTVDILTPTDLGIEAGPDAATVRSVMVSAQSRPPKTAGIKQPYAETTVADIIEFLSQRQLI